MKIKRLSCSEGDHPGSYETLHSTIYVKEVKEEITLASYVTVLYIGKLNKDLIN